MSQPTTTPPASLPIPTNLRAHSRVSFQPTHVSPVNPLQRLTPVGIQSAAWPSGLSRIFQTYGAPAILPVNPACSLPLTLSPVFSVGQALVIHQGQMQGSTPL